MLTASSAFFGCLLVAAILREPIPSASDEFSYVLIGDTLAAGHHNVGVVGRRGVGNHCFLDIDADGVIERIEAETGKSMPLTYTVQSRPASAPWKKHFYFLQTSYSVSRIRTEANRKDTTKWVTSENTGAQMHPTMYDLKGVGGGGLVVAAGSIRKDGELYTVFDDSPVIDFPNWLVDWLVQDIHKYWSDCAKERHQRATKIAALSEPEKAALKEAGDDHGFDIPEADIFLFLNWRASTFASLGMERKTIKKVLIEQVKKFCAGGEQFVESQSGKEQIHKAAFNSSLKIGNANFFNRIGQKKRTALSGLTFPPEAPTRKSLLLSAMKKFPDRVTAENGYERLRKALAGTDFTLERGRSSQKAVGEARKAAGFHTEQTKEGWIWVRSTQSIPQS